MCRLKDLTRQEDDWCAEQEQRAWLASSHHLSYHHTTHSIRPMLTGQCPAYTTLSSETTSARLTSRMGAVISRAGGTKQTGRQRSGVPGCRACKCRGSAVLLLLCC